MCLGLLNEYSTLLEGIRNFARRRRKKCVKYLGNDDFCLKVHLLASPFLNKSGPDLLQNKGGVVAWSWNSTDFLTKINSGLGCILLLIMLKKAVSRLRNRARKKKFLREILN